MYIKGAAPSMLIRIKDPGWWHVYAQSSHASALPPVPGNNISSISCSTRVTALLLLLLLTSRLSRCRLLVPLLTLPPPHLLFMLPHCLWMQCLGHIHNTTVMPHHSVAEYSSRDVRLLLLIEPARVIHLVILHAICSVLPHPLPIC
jgi:hypothetical protein